LIEDTTGGSCVCAPIASRGAKWWVDGPGLPLQCADPVPRSFKAFECHAGASRPPAAVGDKGPAFQGSALYGPTRVSSLAMADSLGTPVAASLARTICAWDAGRCTEQDNALGP
jgi:hypothetical protein